MFYYCKLLQAFAFFADVCIIQAPRSFTFGKQEVTMPQTDCEVILAGDCRSSNKQLLVTIKPASNQGKTAERVSSIHKSEYLA